MNLQTKRILHLHRYWFVVWDFEFQIFLFLADLTRLTPPYVHHPTYVGLLLPAKALPDNFGQEVDGISPPSLNGQRFA
jgi:hypothetical protein